MSGLASPSMPRPFLGAGQAVGFGVLSNISGGRRDPEKLRLRFHCRASRLEIARTAFNFESIPWQDCAIEALRDVAALTSKTPWLRRKAG